MQRQKTRTPIWPYVAVVVCLFLLSVLASQTWRSNHVITGPLAKFQPNESLVFPLAQSKESESSATSSDPMVVSTDHGSDAGPIANTVLELNSPFAIDSPRQVATVLPEVGERITFDVSVKDSPALPKRTPQPEPAATEPPSTEISPQISQSEVTSEPAPRSVPETKSEPSLVEPMPDESKVFPYSADLVREYEQLSEQPLCRDWSRQGLQLLDQIYHSPVLVSQDATKLLQQLASHAQQSHPLSERANSLVLRAGILRVGYATLRRAEVWLQVQKVVASRADRHATIDPNKITTSLAAVEKRLQEASHASEWRNYLLLDEITSLVRTGNADSRRQLAKRVLKRIDSSQLNEKQAEVFRNPPFDTFSVELRNWASEPVDYLQLLDDIEVYERTRKTTDAVPVALHYENLRWLNHPEFTKLTDLLDAHYRNSNVRVALTAEFLNRMLPDPQQIQEDIVDNISGADIYGTSRTLNQLRVVLVPDGNNWRIGLEAHGEVASDTAASKGPATFYNQGLARYHARKLLLIDRRGIRVWRAEAVADSETELTGFETDFDGLPVLGWLARSMARQQHDERYYDAKAEAEAKLESRATERFDQEVHARLAEAEKQLNQKLIQPFEKISLKPTPLDLRTTEQRIIARYRLASDFQLGAHSPRPQAPGDSLLSVQVHESALNNTLANLKLEGKRTELRELYRELAATFERTDLQVPDDIPEDVVVQFADHEAVRVLCEDGRVALTIRIAELKSGRDFRWRNFAVRAYYIPDAKQLHANLVRDGIIELQGERLGDHRLLLRGIFNKVLSKTRTFNIVNKKLAENPRLHDVRVNQFVINDGWIGVAMGPTSAGELEHLAKQRESSVER